MGSGPKSVNANKKCANLFAEKNGEECLVSLFCVRYERVVSKRLDKYLFIIPVTYEDFWIPIILEVVFLENPD